MLDLEELLDILHITIKNKAMDWIQVLINVLCQGAFVLVVVSVIYLGKKILKFLFGEYPQEKDDDKQ